MLTFFKELRRKSRDRSDDTLAFPRSFQKNEAKKIKNLLTNLCVKRKFNTTVIVGGKDAPTCKFESNPYRRQPPTVTLVVGHMWGKRVWDNIYTSMENQRLTNTDYIILSAVEYRTNVRHVRLFEATAYGIKEKEKVNGCIRDPIVVWKEQNTLVDGHNRVKIANELGIPCPQIDKSFADEAEVKTWIIRNQLGRRNLTPSRFEYYIGKLYNEQKAETVEEKQSGGGNVAEKLATEFEISEKSVRRYGTNAKGIDIIERVKGKLEKNKQLSSKPTYTGEEVAVISQAPNITVAAKTIRNIDDYKKQKVEKKKEDKAVAAAVAEKQAFYAVTLCQPAFRIFNFDRTEAAIRQELCLLHDRAG
jgi:hypothetical protein